MGYDRTIIGRRINKVYESFSFFLVVIEILNEWAMNWDEAVISALFQGKKRKNSVENEKKV